MFDGAFSPLHWVVVLVIALLVFGPRKLPEVGRGLGTAIRGFREGLRGLEDAEDKPPSSPSDRGAAPAPAADPAETKK